MAGATQRLDLIELPVRRAGFSQSPLLCLPCPVEVPVQPTPAHQLAVGLYFTTTILRPGMWFRLVSS